MSASGGAKSWFSASELAELKLTGLQSVKRKVNEKAVDERWALRTDAAGLAMARPRAGRGGGLEYHVSILPPSAVTELVRRGLVQAMVEAPAEPPRDQLWAWFDGQPDKVKAEARRRAGAIADVEQLEGAGLTRSAAVAQIAAGHSVSTGTLWNWLGLVAGVAAADRLPRLAPQRKGGGCEARSTPRPGPSSSPITCVR